MMVRASARALRVHPYGRLTASLVLLAGVSLVAAVVTGWRSEAEIAADAGRLLTATVRLPPAPAIPERRQGFDPAGVRLSRNETGVGMGIGPLVVGSRLSLAAEGGTQQMLEVVAIDALAAAGTGLAPAGRGLVLVTCRTVEGGEAVGTRFVRLVLEDDGAPGSAMLPAAGSRPSAL
jgi:hypothetical protein